MNVELNRKEENKVEAIPIMESFMTLQGEGYHSGKPAYFIRIAGCDVGCHWCDVKESWASDPYPNVSVEELITQASGQPGEIVVITGGEPMMYDLDVLTRALGTVGKSVHVETAGVHDLTGEWDWICFSPKKFQEPKGTYFQKCDELKIVVHNKSDFVWAEHNAAKTNPAAKLYLQPEWGKRYQIVSQIVDYIKMNPKWRMSLQIHKYLDIP
jgi:organic radical activating enzyme